jgi:sulfoxide reductase heme-binding subunit YedZ
VFALFVDSYMPFSLTQLLVPGTASYRPFATALGVVGLELLLALAVTNHYRKRLSYRFWRRAHYLNFAVWLLAFGHGLLAGTDRTALWAQSLYIGSMATIGRLCVWRLLTAAPEPATT